LLASLLALLVGAWAISVFLAALLLDGMDDILHPQPIPVDQTPLDYGITSYQNITFTARAGIRLSGWYVPSQNGAAIILAHGHGNNRATLLPEAAMLQSHGYGVLLFDFRGHGESERAVVTIGDHERRDMRAAVDFVAAQTDVDPDRIGALGFSMGAAVLVQVAAEDERLRAVIIEAAFPTLEGVIKNRLDLPGVLRAPLMRWVEWQQNGDIDDVRPVDDLCNISPRPVMLIYGDQDEALPPGSQQIMFEAVCEPVEKWLLPGRGHEYFRDQPIEGYETRILAFFEKELAR